MKYMVDSAKMKQIDKYTMDVIGVPSLVLMERAALEVAVKIKQNVNKEDRILAVCGPGNNGADGVAAARILFLQGFEVAILLTFDREKCSSEMKKQLSIAENLGIKIDNSIRLCEYNIIVDAIFGIGLSKPVAGKYAEIIEEINMGNHTVFSVDIPSGISADTGKVLGTAIKADYTITFGYMKQGLILYPGALYSGEITVSDIGFPEKALLTTNPDAFYFTKDDLCRLPHRKENGHKGTFGKVLVIAGSEGMAGAAYLSAKAAYRTGAGMVKVLTSLKNRNIIQTLIPEALFAAYDANSDNNDIINFDDIIDEEVAKAIKWADVVVIGPGLGISDRSRKLLSYVLNTNKKPLVIDADAINLLAEEIHRIIRKDIISKDNLQKDSDDDSLDGIIKSDIKTDNKTVINNTDNNTDINTDNNTDNYTDNNTNNTETNTDMLFDINLAYKLNRINGTKEHVKENLVKENLTESFDEVYLTVMERIKILESFLPENTVLTPHPMELSRLLGVAVSDITDNIIDIANQCSYNSKLIYVIKNARTIVTKPGSKYINLSGNNGMATAGSGDVLTGIIAGLIAQGLSSYEAACLGVYIHGLAGDTASKNMGVYSMIAGDILESIGEVLQGYNH